MDRRTLKVISYGTMGVAAFSGGMYKGISKANGIDIPFSIDVGATYGAPILGSAIGATIEHKVNMLVGVSNKNDSVGQMADIGAGIARGGVIAFTSEFLGYLTGYVGASLQ